MDCYKCAAKYACKDFEKGRTKSCEDFEREWYREDGEPIPQGARGWSYICGFRKNNGENIYRAHPALYSYELAEAVLRELGFFGGSMMPCAASFAREKRGQRCTLRKGAGALKPPLPSRVMTLKEYVERHEITILQCAYCGRKLLEIDVIWLGCCPLCSDCHRKIMEG